MPGSEGGGVAYVAGSALGSDEDGSLVSVKFANLR